MKVRIQIGEDEVQFTSVAARAMFFHRNKGKAAYLVIDDQPSANLRRYFEGAVVPAVFYQHPESGWHDFGECREALKLEFLLTRAVKGLREGPVDYVAPSLANLTRAQFTAFVDHVTIWMAENGLEVPEPDEYKAWRDSAPPPGEIYPQLKRLKKHYDTIKL